MGNESGLQPGMKVISLLTLVGAVGLLSVGALTVMRRHDESFLHTVTNGGRDITPGAATAIGAVMVILGVAVLALAIALFRGSKVARVIVAIFMLGNLATGVYTLVRLSGVERVSGIGQVVLSALALLVLARSGDRARA
jgi:uncharacterized membrane protein YidH (DUF202 family)